MINEKLITKTVNLIWEYGIYYYCSGLTSKETHSVMLRLRNSINKYIRERWGE